MNGKSFDVAMTDAGAWALAALMLVGSPSGHETLRAADMTAAFKGQTISGAYGNGAPFTETYGGDGKIAYRDSYGPMTGHWSVVNDLFCTFYDAPTAGGCFTVERIGENCFDFYAAAGTIEEAQAKEKRRVYAARGWITTKPPTCPPDLQA
jgi:hypothetical protein